MSYSDFILLHFYLLVVPAVPGSPASPDCTFWVRAEPGFGTPSRVQVANALNFRFSRPSFRFTVRCPSLGVFSACTASQNKTAFIALRGRCRVGSVSLLLFSTFASAMAARPASGERHSDVTVAIQNPESAGVPGPHFEPRPHADGPPSNPSSGIQLPSTLLSGAPLSAIAAAVPNL